jgi:hypothetical protein
MIRETDEWETEPNESSDFSGESGVRVRSGVRRCRHRRSPFSVPLCRVGELRGKNELSRAAGT